MRTSTLSDGTSQAWATPSLTYRGSVGQILQSGGGKLSIAGSDPGEGRCEKPHEAQCNSASNGRGQ
jgi:hypothetical protein